MVLKELIILEALDHHLNHMLRVGTITGVELKIAIPLLEVTM
jgi:hypothetical protein